MGGHLRVACLILGVVATNAGASADQAESAVDIHSIVRDRCQACHQPSGSAPFSLETYDDVKANAWTIQAVLRAGYMPPWKATETDVPFANDRRLASQEKAALLDWIERDCPPAEWRPNKELAAATTSEWPLGPPDLILEMAEAFPVPADGPDIYRSFVFEVGAPKELWIKTIALQSSAQGVLHHALFFADPTGRAAEFQDPDGLPGTGGMGYLRANATRETSFDGFNMGLGGYVPGAMPNRLPEGVARRLPAGADIVMQTHFHPLGKPASERAKIGIYLADSSPDHELLTLQIPSLFGIASGIDIPAGDANYIVEDSYQLPIDVKGIEVGGHAHYLGKSMELNARLPDGSHLSLLQIDDWDLDWQDQYQFASPVVLPKGTWLDARIVYDNSKDNPSNPHSPPRNVTWGRQSTDEMGSMLLSVIAADEAERSVLLEDQGQRVRLAIRERVQSQIGPMLRLAIRGGGWVKMLDRNQDGLLHWREVPDRRRDRLFEFFDLNQDRILDASELKAMQESLRQWL